MIVKQLESPVYYKRRRESLPGRGGEARALKHDKSFDQYLLEAFQGEVVRDGKEFSRNVSSMQRDNLIRLSRI